MLIKQLLDISTPVELQSQNDTDEALYVKGFASVATFDRGNDFVHPFAFNVEQFMTSPTVLVNHKYWVDARGNSVAVGVAKEAYPAVVENDPEDETHYRIVELVEEGEPRINSLLKTAFPLLEPGVSGLFAVVEVTDPDIQAKVLSRELAAFSWKGLARAETVFSPEGEKLRFIKYVDLHEISLVNTGQHQAATFVIGKSDEEIDNAIQAIVFCKQIFKSAGMVREYLKAKSYDHKVVREDTDSFISVQVPIEHFDKKSLGSFQFCPGVSVVAGQYREEVKKTSFVAVPDFESRLNNSVNCEEPKMADTSKVTLEGKNITVKVGDGDAQPVEKAVLEPVTLTTSEKPVDGVGAPSVTKVDDLSDLVSRTVEIKMAQVVEDAVTKAVSAALEAIQKCACEGECKNSDGAPCEGECEPEAKAIEEVEAEPAKVDAPADQLSEGLSAILKRIEQIEAGISSNFGVIAEHIDEQEAVFKSQLAKLQSELDGASVEPSNRSDNFVAVAKSARPQSNEEKRAALAGRIFSHI